MMPGTLILVGAACAAAYTDLSRRRVPNALTFGLAAVAMVAAAVSGPVTLLTAFALYCSLMLAGTFLFARGWIGGGDVKLLAAGAACIGWPGALTFLLYVGLAGGVLALAELARSRRLRGAMHELATAVYVGTLQYGVVLDPDRRRLPYALAIAAGALL
ncbi:MAG TPA: prepilin peptidase, partial [Candidatus Elarobacter sp.]